MRTTLLAATLACIAPALAHAAPTTWNFSYTGFDTTLRQVDNWAGTDVTTTGFRADATVAGSFTGADNNGNGLIELSELTGFTLGRDDYFGCAPSGDMVAYTCSIDRFSFDPAGTLDVKTSVVNYGEVYWSRGIDFTAGSAYNEYDQGRYTSQALTYAWTGQTRFAAVAAPVPEPAGAGMAAAGVLLLGVTACARRSRSSRAA